MRAEFCDGWLEVIEVTEFVRVPQRELEWLEGVIETDDMYRNRKPLRRAQHGQNIGRSAKPNVPDDEFAGMLGQPFSQAELLDVERLAFGHRPHDRMERLAMCHRVDALNAIGETHDFVSFIRLHATGCHKSPRVARKSSAQ